MSGFNSTWTVKFQVFKLDFKKAEEQRSNCQHPLNHQKKKTREFQKNNSFWFIDFAKSFDCVDHNKLWKIFKKWEYQTTLPTSWETCMQVKKQPLEPDIEQRTGPKLGKEYVKAVYCHPGYLIYMQSISCEMPGWMNHRLESRLLGEMSIISDTQMTPLLWQKAKRN